MYELIYTTHFNESIGKAPTVKFYTELQEAVLQMEEYKSYGWSVEIWKENDRIY